jgi:malonyl-CoA O-methyltransferase
MNILVSTMSEPDQTRPPLDAVAALRWQHIALVQARQSGAPWLHEEVGSRMAQRLSWIKRQPDNWVNWRPLPSGAAVHNMVQQAYPNAKPFLAPPPANPHKDAHLLIANQGRLKGWMSKLRGQAAAMMQPVQEGEAQMVWANMSLHTESDPAETVKQWHRMLAVDGYLMFSCLGPDTALALRQIYADEGWGSAAHPLTDMHDWGDLLVGTGFAEPVMDMERIVLSFASPERALQELRGLGRNLHPARFVGLRGKSWRKMLHAHMQERLSNAQGHIELTFEIIYGHAFKPVPRLKVSAESAISMRDMRAMLVQGKARRVILGHQEP